MLLGLSIKNFALLESFDFGMTAADLSAERIDSVGETVFPLKRMSAIIGRNNSGKSFFFEALDFLGDCLRFNVPYAATLYGRGGFSKLHTLGSAGNIRFELLYLTPWSDELLNYELELSGDRYGRPAVAAEKVTSIPVNKDMAARIKGSSQHAAFKTGEKPQVRVLLEFTQGKGGVLAQNSSANWESSEFADLKTPALASFGKMLKYKSLRSLYQFISGIFFLRDATESKSVDKANAVYAQGGHRHIDREASNVRNVLAYLKQEDLKEYKRMMRRIEDRIPSSQRMGDLVLDQGIVSGAAKLFVILLLLQDPKPRPLILLENPDTSLYHDMVEELGKAFRDYVLRQENVQLFFSTHSTILLESLTPYEVWVIKRPHDGKERSYLQMVEDIAPVRRSTDALSLPNFAGQAELSADEDDDEDNDKDEDNDDRVIHESGSQADSTVETDPGSTAYHSGSKASCVAGSALVRAMYKEGVGLGALWYSGHFDIDDGPGE